MKAMILAAGKGERMRPLTDDTPKPLLKVAGLSLIVRQVQALATAGISELVINTGIMGEQIHEQLGNGERYGVTIQYSVENGNPLETAGGIIKALPLLDSDTFIVTNADVVTDFDYTELRLDADKTAHLVLVENPKHHPEGDFGLKNGLIHYNTEKKYTFSGIGIYHRHFFDGYIEGVRPLAPLIRQASKSDQVSGELFQGYWNDVGTQDRLEKANRDLL